MKWLYTKQLLDLENIVEFEKQYNVKFSKIFIEFMVERHAARPEPYIIDAEVTKEIPAKSLLSFDKAHKPEDIWSSYDSIKDRLPVNVVPFMGDEGGNYFCIDLDPLSDVEEILYWSHESNQVQKVAVNLNEFIGKFYDF